MPNNCKNCKYAKTESSSYVWCKVKFNRVQVSKIKECKKYEKKDKI